VDEHEEIGLTLLPALLIRLMDMPTTSGEWNMKFLIQLLWLDGLVSFVIEKRAE
jgi:hypothetical protein